MDLAPAATIDRSVAFRRDFGLSTDRALLSHLAHDRRAVIASLRKYGVPLTPREERDLDARGRAARSIAVIARWLEATPEYAGRFIDQSNGGSITLNFVGNAEHRLGEAKRRFPYPGKLRTRIVEHTLDELTHLRDTIVRNREQLLGEQDALEMVWIDERVNRVVVMTPRPTLAIRGALRELGGSAVEVRAGTTGAVACVSRLDCRNPLRAGLDMQTAFRHCTTGFMGWDAHGTNDIPPSTNLDYFILTAGHCVEGNGGPWYHGGSPIGSASRSFYRGIDGQADTSGLDGAIIPIDPLQASNLIYTTAGDMSPYPAETTQAIDDDTQGESVCVSTPYYDQVGSTVREGAVCGWIEGRGAITTGDDGQEFIAQRLVSLPVENTPAVVPGDSGGPVFKNPNIAVGLVSQDVRDAMGYPTHMFVYSQIGFLNAYSGSGHDYRVLTTPGPGAPLTGGEVEGPYRLVANPNDPEAEEDWGYNVRFRHVPLPRSGEGETWQIRGPGWAAIAPANLTSDENRLQVQVEPGGLYEGEFSLYEFLYPGYRISRRTEGSDIIWDVSMPDVPTDWGSPITAPWGAQIWFWFQTADSSFNPDLYPAPRLVVSDEPQE